MRLRLIALALAAVASVQAATTIADPEAFVRDVYKKFQAGAGNGYDAPKDIFTPRLRALFVRDEKWAKGEVGCLDFDYWVNGQDWKLSNLKIASRANAKQADLMVVVATFVNLGQPNEIHFDFRRSNGKWLLDDVSSLSGERWTLSKILSCPH